MCAIVQKVPEIVQLTQKVALQNLVVVHQEPVIKQQKRVADELLMFVVVNYSTADKREMKNDSQKAAKRMHMAAYQSWCSQMTATD
jgi:hypothetical protein